MVELSEAELEELEQRAKKKLETSDPHDSWCYIAVGADDVLRLIAELRDLRTKVDRLEGEVAEAIERGEP